MTDPGKRRLCGRRKKRDWVSKMPESPKKLAIMRKVREMGRSNGQGKVWREKKCGGPSIEVRRKRLLLRSYKNEGGGSRKNENNEGKGKKRTVRVKQKGSTEPHLGGTPRAAFQEQKTGANHHSKPRTRKKCGTHTTLRGLGK